MSIGSKVECVQFPETCHKARQEVLDKIPTAYRIDPELLGAKYGPGSDMRPLAAESGILTAEELAITDPSTDATEILANIKSKKWTAVQVTTAFGKRACLAHQATCCLIDLFLEEGLQRARELDEYYERTGELVGPLHGLPHSIKGVYSIKGLTTTAGFIYRKDAAPESKNSLCVQILWDAGCVFYCTTNNPQTVMHLETHSAFGETVNPINNSLTPGGSSGGCSALMAFGGSPISIGGDIGGSLRSPAANCGLWTLKPTTLRVPAATNWPTMPGNTGLLATSGPIARSLRDVHLWMDVVLKPQTWKREPAMLPIDWVVPTSPTWSGTQNKIRVGVMRHDDVVLSQPPIRRALDTVVKLLEQHQDKFEVVEYKAWKHAEIVEMAHILYWTDGGKKIREHMQKGEEPLLPLTEWVLSRPGVREYTVNEVWELYAKRDALRSAYLAQFTAQNIDVILCPTGPGPAPVLGTSKYWGYTAAFNFLDWPAAVFPTGLTVSPELDPVDAQKREFMSPEDQYLHECYAPEKFARAPLALQLVARRYDDEKLLVALEKITEVLELK